jgi:hypothetical protein
MRRLLFLFAGLAAASALPASDPVAACRAEHAVDSSEYVACLEAALRAQDSDHGDQPETAGSEVDAGPSGLGAEQVRKLQRDAENEEVSVQIVSTTYNAWGLGTFRTEDGQIWRETTRSPERRRLAPDAQYTARIVRAKIGGYRMHVEGIRWMKTVERIE